MPSLFSFSHFPRDVNCPYERDLCSTCMEKEQNGASNHLFLKIDSPLPLPPLEELKRFHKSTVTCPLISEEFERKEGEGGRVHKGVRCRGCGGEVKGVRYLCVYCEDFSLCEECEPKVG